MRPHTPVEELRQQPSCSIGTRRQSSDGTRMTAIPIMTNMDRRAEAGVSRRHRRTGNSLRAASSGRTVTSRAITRPLQPGTRPGPPDVEAFACPIAGAPMPTKARRSQRVGVDDP